ncbi:MAG: glycoside hydrolase N-terminal domain-containing protein [Verrucomicrobiae bacterium]
MKTLKKAVNLGLLWAMSAGTLWAAKPSSEITAVDSEALYKTPARGFVSHRSAGNDWEKSLLSGNGIVGVMVPGNPFDETLYLSHAALYMPRDKRTQPIIMANHFEEIRRLCMEGKFDEAGEMIVKIHREDTAQHGYSVNLTDPFIGACTLRIEQEPEDVSRYQRSVDFMTGEATVTYTSPEGISRRSTFVSRADDVIVVRLDGSAKQEAAISFAELEAHNFKEAREICKRIKEVNAGVLSDKFIQFQSTFATPNADNPVVGYEAVGRIIHKGGSFGRTQPGYQIRGAEKILVLIKIRPRLRSDKGETSAPEIRRELEALPADYGKLLAAHAKIHGDLMGRVSFSLNAPAEDRAKATEYLMKDSDKMESPLAQIERAFDAGRYNIISSTGYNPPNLQGLWNASWLARWGSALTTDANVPCAVAFLGMGNTPELMEPYFRFYERMLPGFRKLMKEVTGMRGFLVPAQLTTAPVFVGISPSQPFCYWYAGAAWACQFFYDHWQYTGDRKFLEERAYPLMKETAAFYEDYLTNTDKNGWVVFAPTYSPENGPDGSYVRTSINATMEVGAARQLLRNTIAAAKELGRDDELQKKWAELLAKIPPYEVGPDGSFREWLWPGLKDSNLHRHASHFYPLYDEMPPEIVDSPALKNAVCHSVRERLTYLENKSSGAAFGVVQNGLAAARVGDAELAQRVINELGKNYWSTGMGSYSNRHGMFMMDISGGFPYVCASTLVYSDPGLIRFFPARPPQWKSGSIKGLRLRGAITLKDLTWDEKGAKAVLVSDKDQNVTIITPAGKKKTVSLKAGQATEVNCE